jgi:hypothetical protein
VRNFDAGEDVLVIPATTSATLVEAGNRDATGNLGDQEFGFITGTFSGTDDNGQFVVNSAGSDTLVFYDADSAAGTTDIESIILVGVSNLSTDDLA